MAVKYHVNPGTGRVGKCEAGEGKCPHGSDTPHGATREEAKKAYEAQQTSVGRNISRIKSNPLNLLSSSKRRITREDFLTEYNKETSKDNSIETSESLNLSQDLYHSLQDITAAYKRSGKDLVNEGVEPLYIAAKNSPTHIYSDKEISSIERTCNKIEKLSTDIEGTLNRGVSTEKFESKDTLNDYVKNKYPLEQTIDSNYISTSRSPIIAHTFASGYRMLPEKDPKNPDSFKFNNSNKVHQSGKNSGYVIEIQAQKGFHLSYTDEGDYNPDNEKEVLIPPSTYIVKKIIESSESKYGKPIVIMEQVKEHNNNIREILEKHNKELKTI